MKDRCVLCAVHCYYPEFVAELAECVGNVSGRVDVVVTYSTADAMAAAKKHFPTARFVECENVGFDIWPFLKVLDSVRLEDYDYILKLHTKCNRPTDVPFRMNNADFSGARWREYLLSFVRTAKDWEASLALMESDPSIAMVAGLKCILRRKDTPWRPEQLGFDVALEMADALGIRPGSPEFVAGTMFVARSDVFGKLKGRFSASDFSSSNVHTTVTSGHYLERIFGFAACDAGRRISDPYDRVARYRRLSKAFGVVEKIGKFFFQRKRTTDGGIVVKVLKIPVWRSRGVWRSGRNDNEGCVFVTVVRDHGMYSRLVKDNPANVGARFVAFDNLAENLPITVRFNSFLSGWDYSRKAWFVFVHEDYEFLEPVGPYLDRLDGRCIYGTVGARSTCPGDDALWALNSNRDGSNLGLYGRPIKAPVPVLTVDCNCVIVHSDLVRDYGLRFDENLTFDLYAEDFSINAFEKYGVRTKVIGVRNHHYSFGNITKRFFMQRRYLLEKYKNASRVYGTTTKQLIGPMELVLAARRKNRCRRRMEWIRRIGRFFWYCKYSRDGMMRLRVFGLRFKRRSVGVKAYRVMIEYGGMKRRTENSIAEILDFPVHGDHAGSLVALEKGADFPFEIKRVYYIWGTAKDVVRGHHAHRNLEQVIVCTSGSCDFILDDGKCRETYRLNSPAKGLHIRNNVWREFTNFSPDCVVMVLASEHYNEADYIRDYEEFLRSVGK